MASRSARPRESQSGARARIIHVPDQLVAKRGNMVLKAGAAPERVTVWQCIGCGRIEGPQNCIGVCEDRKVELVYADVHEEALARLGRLRREAEALKAVVERLAHTTPRAGEWERSYRALQAQARAVLGTAAGTGEA